MSDYSQVFSGRSYGRARHCRRRSAFTLVELLVVVAIICLLAAILFPVFATVRERARQTSCLSNLKQIGLGLEQYLSDYDSIYPQEHPTCPNPAIGTASTTPQGDFDGSNEGTDYGSPFDKVSPYISHASSGNQNLFVCPSDTDPRGATVLDSNGNCLGSNPLSPPPGSLTSYLLNAYFLFGLNESAIPDPSQTIYVVERNGKFCDVHVHPWLGEVYDASGDIGAVNGNQPLPSFLTSDPNFAPDGYFAINSARHNGGANYLFSDGHAKWENYETTITPNSNQPYFGQYQALPGKPTSA